MMETETEMGETAVSKRPNNPAMPRFRQQLMVARLA
jgi:hypothetical protein